MGVEAWPKLLLTYGPFAILVLLVFITERKSRVAKNEAAPGEKRTLVIIYLLNWLAIFSLVIFSSYVWFRINVDREITIKGKIENLSGLEAVTSTAKMYLRSVYLAPGRADYEWRLVGDDRWPDGDTINFTFNPSMCAAKESEITDFTLTVKPAFYDKEVRIAYSPAENKMFVYYDGKQEELPRSQRLIAYAEEPAPERGLFTTVAHAQEPFSAEGFARSLDSPDVNIRRAARGDLAKRGAAAVPWIEQVLADPRTGYRVRLGVIVALNNMPELRADTLKPATLEAIKKAADDPDDTLRNEARSFIGKHQSALSQTATFSSPSAPVVVYRHYSFDGESQEFKPGVYRANRREFGRLPNDSASSLIIARGYAVRLCDNEGTGKGGGLCIWYGEGKQQLKGGVADRVSYIEVIKRP
jgi:hypothetical protein